MLKRLIQLVKDLREFEGSRTSAWRKVYASVARIECHSTCNLDRIIPIKESIPPATILGEGRENED